MPVIAPRPTYSTGIRWLDTLLGTLQRDPSGGLGPAAGVVRFPLRITGPNYRTPLEMLLSLMRGSGPVSAEEAVALQARRLLRGLGQLGAREGGSIGQGPIHRGPYMLERTDVADWFPPKAAAENAAKMMGGTPTAQRMAQELMRRHLEYVEKPGGVSELNRLMEVLAGGP